MRFVGRLLRRFFVDTWREIDAEREPADASPAAAPAARSRSELLWPLVVLVTVAVALTIQEYIGERDFFRQHFPDLAAGDYGELRAYAWWSAWRFIGYVVLPVLVILCAPGQRLRDYYVSLRQFARHFRIYLALFMLVLPFVIGAAQFSAFYYTYPFYKLANRSPLDFWTWEALYALQFVSLEFFFRGFMLHGLRRRFGAAAIFVMVVPYCMIHYGKPMAETFGAIVAGLVLGTLAMRTRSIWGGAAIHIAVALTMDLLAVSQCPPADSGLRCPMHGDPLG
ncbi:MAG TPA: type II CAAX endopeptidase family protein [Kofleriaceae bacterium]|nr:type II CAAX endopeptidase family protein [Kofleriaceae bacterium]